MRKHKSVVAILLAVMMIFTFMPAMAFASVNDDTGVWKTSYNSMATKTWMNDGDGTVKMWVDSSAVVGQKDEVYAASYRYYDLSTAEVKAGKSYTYDAFSKFVYQNSDKEYVVYNPVLLLNKPADATAENASTASKPVNFSDGSLYNVVVKAEGYDPESYAEQTVTLKTTVTPKTMDSAGAALAAKLVNAVPDKTVKVEAREGSLNDVKFYVDKVATGNEIGSSKEVNYTGDAIKIVTNEVPGMTVAYKLQNSKTSVYEDMPTAEVKNAGKYYIKATITDTTKTKDNTKDVYFLLTVKAAKGFSYSWDKAVAKDGSRTYIAEVPENADPTDYIVVNADYVNTNDSTVTKEMVEADKEVAMKYFAEKYDVTVTPNTADPTLVTWSFKKKANFDAATVDKAYAEFLGNYKYYSAYDADETTDSAHATRQFKLVKASSLDTKDDDITFSGQTKYVYSGKKTTKKGVLKAKKTIKVNAVADSGNAMTFTATKTSNSKITVNATTGAITVKKGLKKGTYKVTVKAKTAAGNGYKAAKATQTYTIVIKK